MKRLFFIALCLLIAYPCFGGMVMRKISSGAEAYCGGGELFCATFESDAEISWDSTPGAEDCDGYDANGDWCDYDSSNGLQGSYGCGIRGDYSNYLSEALSSTTDEFYVEFWWKADDVTSANILALVDAGDSTHIARVRIGADDTIEIYLVSSASIKDSGDTLSDDTTYHIGYYYKEETGSNDGISRIWMNTDGSEFDAGDLILDDSAGDTGSTDVGTIRLRGPTSNHTGIWDNVQVIDGAPSWPTS
jgi:hypothetical protein